MQAFAWGYPLPYRERNVPPYRVHSSTLVPFFLGGVLVRHSGYLEWPLGATPGSRYFIPHQGPPRPEFPAE